MSLEQIRADLAAATPGPWAVFGTLSAWEDETELGVGPDNAPPVAEGLDLVDAQLIANAPTHLAALLGAVEAVLALHTEEGDGWRCEQCSTLAQWTVPWPCPTVAAIHQHLGDAQ